MAWNKETYYYQNQMKTLSGTDPEPGYREDDDPIAAPENLNERIEQNGLYKFVSLIKAKIDEIWEAIFGAWRLQDEEHEILVDDDLNDKVEVGNYWYSNGTGQREIHNIQHRPDGTYIAFTLKVSRVKKAPNKRWQDFIQQSSGHRWYRYATKNNDVWEWGPWKLVLSTVINEGEEFNPSSNGGSADDLFLKRKDDFTTGAIGFGKDPIEGTHVSVDVKAKIILGQYSYGADLPSVHYSNIHDSNIPKGQIYLQYD